MASTRKQPTGRYQGIAVHPSGRRQTKVFRLQGQALTWAQEEERKWRRGQSFEPDAAKITVKDWIDAWATARRVDPITAKKEASHLRNHIGPKWNAWPLTSVRRMDVAGWVKEMERAGVGAHTITAVVSLFSTILRSAVEEDRLTKNPASRISVPALPAKPPFFWSRQEAGQILEELAEPWRTACDLTFHVGLRLGELLGLRVGAVDWPRGQLFVVGAMTREGWREHPKSMASRRALPIPFHLVDVLRPLVVGRPEDAPVFAGVQGAMIGDAVFRTRIWEPAVARAGACAAHRDEGRRAPGCRGCKLTKTPGRPCPAHRVRVAAADRACEACLPVPEGSPHDMRHTAASWLVQAGIDLYRVQQILGHESFKTTQRYAHLLPGAHSGIQEVWKAGNLSAVEPHQITEAPSREPEKGL